MELKTKTHAQILNAMSSLSAESIRAAIRSRKLSPTESRNARSTRLDSMPVADSVELMLNEEARVTRVLLKNKALLTRAVDLVTQAFRSGGKLFYFGAGTSGRLGVLDASECPPTFRVPSTLVQGVIAGGDVALRSAVEGAEDDAAAGAREVRSRRITQRDVVVGIAASGTTPFVWGALVEARLRGAKTILLCFNPHLVIPRKMRPALVIALDLGAEVLTGSTRLKAGTATKLILNILTTLAMVRLGKVQSNLMVDLNPSNVKLRARAIRIVRELTGHDEAAAKTALEKSGWIVKRAVAALSIRHQ
jgi:N-acetylmuramic acid 6-phosphate etherase